MSSATAVVVLVITIVVLGAISFVVFNTAAKTTCAPADSPACIKIVNTHDITILAPFTTAQQDQLIPFTQILSSGETATKFTFNFGDGATFTGTSPTATHAYANPGTYLVFVTALVGSTLHDNLHAIQVVTITSSHTRDTLGTQPGISGTFTNTTGAPNPTGVLATGAGLTVTGLYTSNSSNPTYAIITPKIIASGGTLGTPTTSTTATGFPEVKNSITFAAAGTYTVTFVAGTSLSGVTYYQNYTWTAYVSSPSGAAVVTAQKVDPHPNEVIAYEYAPGGAGGEDPAVDYETVGYEVTLNVYQKLIDYNGTKAIDSPSGYIPVIATCVPGSAVCGTQFPTEPAAGETNLVQGYNYTFVIGASSHFYDPATGTSWGVWASDVLFSMARDMAMASDGEATPSWVQGQAVLPFGNAAWDGALHSPYNSTATQILNQIQVNNTAFCPTAALTTPSMYHGCVTFVANGTGTTPGAKTWPFFLELMSAIGSAIVPAGWFSAQDSYLPGWTVQASGPWAGDHPVTLGSAAVGHIYAYNASPASTYQAWVTSIGPTGWDPVSANLPSNHWGNVQYHMAGSGPYYLAGYTIGTSYTLKANPAYEQNPACTTTYVGETNWCTPAPGTYAPEIDVTWEVDPTPGEAALASGVADFAGIPTTQTALTLQLIQEGKASAIDFPSISIFFFAYDMNFSAAAASSYPTGPITAPADFFSYIGTRNLFSTSYPYATSQSTINTVAGIQYGFNYGGVVPQGMGNYYPTNISWPAADPVVNYSNPASPAYWWAALTSPHFAGGMYYSSEIATDCTPAHPCQLPFFGQTGAPNYDQALALETQKVAQYTNGSVVIHTLDINFIQLVINSLFSPPGDNPMPIFTLGWAPDYPDPTDYIGAMYYPNATYTYSDDYNEFTENPAENATTCAYNSIGAFSFAALQYYANPSNPVAQDCQGPAFNVMTFAEFEAAEETNLNERALLYNMAEHISQKLALYIYFEQQNAVFIYAPWVNGLSIDEHVTIGGGGDIMWFWVNGNGLA